MTNSKNKLILILLICCGCFISSSAYCETTFKIFQTQQPAHTLLPVIKPLFADQAKIITKNNSLIVKASPAILKEIEQLLSEIDKPLHNLLIEVSSSLVEEQTDQQNNIDAQISMGDDSLISTRSSQPLPANSTIRYSKNGTVIKTTHTRRSHSRSSPESYKVRTLEGNWAVIHTGKKVPYYSSRYPNRNHYRQQKTMELVDVTSGFEVLPILNGERVILKVRPQTQSLNRQHTDRIDTRSMETTITGRLDQWIFLGGTSNKITQRNNGTFHSSKRHSDLDSNYRIKVSIIDK